MKRKLIRITTVPISLMGLLRGQSRFMKDYYDVIGISSPGPELQTVRDNEQIRVISVPMTRSLSPLKDILSLIRLYRIFKTERPFIVHSHTPKAGTIGMIAAKLAGVPCRLHTVAGLPLLEAKGLKRKLLNYVERVTYLCATKVYPNSQGLHKIIVDSGFAPNSKVKVIAKGSSNGINIERFNAASLCQNEIESLQRELGLTPSNFVFIFVGRIVGDKGINELIEAFNRINRRFPSTRLLLVGQQEKLLDPLAEETISSIERNESIISVGFQNDVRQYYALADVLVFPSYREGFPNVVMQAGAMELPSIVSDINGCNEIVIDGVNGLIIPPKDVLALESSMLRILEDQDLRYKLSANARQRIIDRYDQKFVWNAILSEYRMWEQKMNKF